MAFHYRVIGVQPDSSLVLTMLRLSYAVMNSFTCLYWCTTCIIIIQAIKSIVSDKLAALYITSRISFPIS